MSTTRIPKVTLIFSACCLVTAALGVGRDPAKHKQYMDVGVDGRTRSINADVQNKKETSIKHATVDLKSREVKHTVIDNLVVPMSAAEVHANSGAVCEDAKPQHTGFEVHGDAGFKHHASCEDLAQHCHDPAIGEQVRVSCPLACFICTPAEGDGEDVWHGKCYDAVNTGIRFREGPKASCSDLINYCNHTSIGQQVKEACKLSCGLCQLHLEGPYLDAYGNCEDLSSHEEPEFTVAGSLAGCSDMAQFCQNHPDSYLIRHKCPLTCGVCGNVGATTASPDASDVQIPGDTGGCDRRRRWGFCSTRRRRNI